MNKLDSSKLSTTAWEMASHIYDAIINHPFNQELMAGTLSQDKFAYYIEQDSLYLQDFAKCHAIIASKISSAYTRTFLKYAEHTFIAEEEVVHGFFRKIFGFQKTNHLTPATLSYTSYLLRICTIEPVEVAVAAILPCVWIYREVGFFIAKNSSEKIYEGPQCTKGVHEDPDEIFDTARGQKTEFRKGSNPYARWIETYSSKDFSASVDEVINIFDCLSENTTEDIRRKMLDAFYKSSSLEWHFWNDAYNKTIFDVFQNPTLAHSFVELT